MKKVPMTIPLKSSMEFAGTSTVFWVPEDIAEMYMKDGLYDNARNVFMQREAFWASKRREVEKQMTLNNLQSNKSKVDYPMSYFDNWYSQVMQEAGATYSNYSDMYAVGMYKIRWWKEEPNKPYKLYARVAEGSSALRLVAEFDTLGEAYKRIHEIAPPPQN